MYSFETFLDESNAGSNRDIVGLAFYYLHSYGDEDTVTVQEIGDLLDVYSIPLSGTAVAAHVVELRQESLLTVGSEDRYSTNYLLTEAGFRVFGRLAGEWGQYGARSGRFIDTDRVNDQDYELLISNINRSYRNVINDATLVLTRKLFENLIIDILRAEFGNRNIDLYFNTNWGRHHGLGRLCSNLRDNIQNLQHYSRQLDNGLVDRIEEFKEQGNAQAHTIRIGVSDNELEDLKRDATELTDTLWVLRQEVRAANN